LDIQATLAEIPEFAFYMCYNIKGSLKIPDGVTRIAPSAFGWCYELTALELGTKLKTIGESAFYYCTKLQGELIIPDGVTRIETSAFAFCKNLSSVQIGAGVKEIHPSAFADCVGITTAQFVNTAGWSCSKHNDASGVVTLPAADLQDEHTAALYLTQNYATDYWQNK
jgi:hypothetical protein